MQINEYLDFIATTEQMQRNHEKLALIAQNISQEADLAALTLRRFKKELNRHVDKAIRSEEQKERDAK